MILTNKFLLPESIVNIVKKGMYRPTEDKMRTTELIGSPLVKGLTIKHWDKIETDVSDYLWMLLGTSVHYILEGGIPENAIGEEELFASLGDTVISGKPDLYNNNGIEDWKVTSVFSFLLGIKKEWIAQLNIYRWLYMRNGFEVESLKINAILRDWQRSKAKFDMNYPQIPFVSLNVPIWNDSVITEYIFDRIAIHAQNPAPECTDEEKWKREDSYAVMKENAKRATRVLDTKKEAEKYIEDMDEKKRKDFIIEERKGACIKCDDYCIVKNHCPFYEERG